MLREEALWPPIGTDNGRRTDRRAAFPYKKGSETERTQPRARVLGVHNHTRKETKDEKVCMPSMWIRV